jgi:hypothetical protein
VQIAVGPTNIPLVISSPVSSSDKSAVGINTENMVLPGIKYVVQEAPM